MNFFAKLALGALLAALPGAVTAQQTDSAPQATPPLLTEADSLDPFKWIARPVIVFADSPNDPRFIEQINLLQQRPEALLERDVVVIADTDPANPSEIRRQLRPRGFSYTPAALPDAHAKRADTPAARPVAPEAHANTPAARADTSGTRADTPAVRAHTPGAALCQPKTIPGLR